MVVILCFIFFFFKQKTAYEISACLVGSEMCIRDRLIDDYEKNSNKITNMTNQLETLNNLFINLLASDDEIIVTITQDLIKFQEQIVTIVKIYQKSQLEQKIQKIQKIHHLPPLQAKLQSNQFKIPNFKKIQSFKPIKSNPDDNLCIVCIERPQTHMVLPCGHLKYCSVCIEFVIQKQQCFYCRGNVASVKAKNKICLLYTSDAADEEDSVDICSRRSINNKTST
eukprot:TRINITY_DN6586_c0_g1_i1.p1 TRINITY_DN6586_c0_g1~~TRINITY_DN6586_c0_g1_i1.p1  ORF type:complete len:225 (+),score=36.45 TRINITY_DN6586_c0_g1_i1:119-793(+)